MKAHEAVLGYRLSATACTVLRLDGRCFRGFTRGFERPFDARLSCCVANFWKDNITLPERPSSISRPSAPTCTTSTSSSVPALVLSLRPGPLPGPLPDRPRVDCTAVGRTSGRGSPARARVMQGSPARSVEMPILT